MQLTAGACTSAPPRPKWAVRSDWRGHTLPVGSVAPDFELPDLTGARRKLAEFRGRDVLLIFFNPKCGFCTKMAADLAGLPADGGPDRVGIVVVTTGDVDENRKLIEKHGIRR